MSMLVLLVSSLVRTLLLERPLDNRKDDDPHWFNMIEFWSNAVQILQVSALAVS